MFQIGTCGALLASSSDCGGARLEDGLAPTSRKAISTVGPQHAEPRHATSTILQSSVSLPG